MNKSEQFVFASSVFEEKKEPINGHKSATVKTKSEPVEAYHETYY
jgi:hypothetical protein